MFPDASKLKLTAIYTPAGGTEPQQAEQALKSRTSGVDGVLAVGMQGNTVVYRADTQDAQGMTQYQDYTLTIRRAPTLKQLRVTEESGAPPRWSRLTRARGHIPGRCSANRSRWP